MSELCVLSLPRQGTDFFMSCVEDQGNYQREWFNPCEFANKKFSHVLLPHFGSELEQEGLFSVPSAAEFANALQVWRGLNLNMTKEVWSFSKSRLFAESMHVAYLFRKRRHTFPSSRPDFFLAIWDSLMSSNTAEGLSGEIRSYLISREIRDPRVRQIVIHAAAWVIQLHSAPRQIIYYDSLMEFSSGHLVDHLAAALPPWVDARRVASNVEQERKWDRLEREESYEKFISGCDAEKEIEMLLSFLSKTGVVSVEKIIWS